jgi:UDP-N-acetylglucosamine acyltransferase
MQTAANEPLHGPTAGWDPRAFADIDEDWRHMTSTIIHPTAIVEDGATLGEGCRIGPYCIVGPHVVLGERCDLKSHVVVTGRTSVGPRTRMFPFASIGHAPQDLKYAGEPTTLSIGADCTIREGVTMNPGTAGGLARTLVGDRGVFLANSHVAHDCIVGNDVVFSNNAMLAGHCKIQDFVIIGGGAGVHQFVRIGQHAFIGGMSAIENDVIPYGMALGNRAHLAGLNIIGLRRRGFTRDQIHDIRRAYRLIFADEGTLAERLDDVAAEFATHPFVHEILDFIRDGKDRAICTPREPVGAP